MRKTVLSMMAFAAIAFASCGNKQGADTAKEDSLKVEAEAPEVSDEIEELAAQAEGFATLDGDAINSALEANEATVATQAIETAKTRIQSLIDAGKTEAANLYAAKVKTYVDAASEKLQNLGVDASGINGVISNALGGAQGAASSAVEAATGTVDAAKAAGETAVQNAKDAAKNAANTAVETAKNTANTAIEGAKNAANSAVQNATNAAGAAVGNALNKALGGQQ